MKPLTTASKTTLRPQPFHDLPRETESSISGPEGVFVSLDALAAKSAESSAKHGAEAFRRANAAIETMNKELAYIKRDIAKHRPDLKDSGWDFVMKDGKLKVSGGKLSQADAKYVERKLNGDAKLVDSIKSFNAAAVLNLQTTADNPSVNYLSPYIGHLENRTFYKVADQMNGTVNYGALLENTKKYEQIDKSGSAASMTNNLAQMGAGALDVLASALMPSNQKIDMFGFTFDSTERTVSRSKPR